MRMILLAIAAVAIGAGVTPSRAEQSAIAVGRRVVVIP